MSSLVKLLIFCSNLPFEKSPDKSVAIDENVDAVWPFAGLANLGTMLEANFGQDQDKPFKYSIWKLAVNSLRE